MNVQQTKPFGTPVEVRTEVRLRVQTFGQGGGLIRAPAHVLGPETHWDNILAFFEPADTTTVGDFTRRFKVVRRRRRPSHQGMATGRLQSPGANTLGRCARRWNSTRTSWAVTSPWAGMSTKS